MKARLFGLVSVVAVALVACGGGATTASNSALGATDSELRPLQDAEILGSIAPGQTKGPYRFSGAQQYNALRFAARHGDDIKLTLRSGGSLKVWLEGPNDETLALASASHDGQDVVVSAVADVDGDHFIVWRELHHRVADVTASLEQTIYTPTTQSIALERLFDGSLKEGPEVPREQLVSYFAPAATKTEVGGFVVKQRTRRCNSVTGCAAWAYPQNVSFLVYDGTNTTNTKATVTDAGAMGLTLSSTSVFSLTAPAAHMYMQCSNVTSGSTCTAFGANNYSLYADYGTGQWLGWYNLNLALYPKADYVYASQLFTSGTDSAGTYYQTEYALFGSWTLGVTPVIVDE